MTDPKQEHQEENEADVLDQEVNPDTLRAEQQLADALAEELSDQTEVEDNPAEEDPFEVLRAENQQLKEQLLRERADFDNIRKRLRREADESGSRAVARFVRPVLVQLDNFSLALEAANPEAFMDFAMGVTMIRDGIVSALSDSGISPVETQGQFDPALHEVVAEIPNDLPKGYIVTTQRAGYRMGSQLVRAAQVIVSAGPAEVTDEASSEDESSSEAEGAEA